jgi:hypothetical protein
MITIGTVDDPPTDGRIGNHMYAVHSYNFGTGKFKLYNPWNGDFTYIELTWAELQANCQSWGKTDP